MAALALAVTAAAGAVSMYLPMPTFPLWLAHVAALETALAIAGIGLVAASMSARALRQAARAGVRSRHDQGRMQLTAALGAAAALAALLPPAAVAPLFAREQVSFSLVEYVLGAPGAAVRVEPDVVLDPRRSDLTADVYHAPGPGPHPFVLIVHGGSWRGGDKGAAPQVSRALAAAGRSVLDVRYRLAPQHPFPAAVADVKCLLGRAREKAPALGLDASRAALMGRSAGGQIALVAAYSAGDARIPPSCEVADEPVSSVVAIYAPTDLAWGHGNPLRPDVIRGPETLELYLGGSPSVRPEAYRLGSPQAWTHRPLPPTLLIHGSGDRLVSVEHSRRLARVLANAGQPVRLLEIPLAEHGFDTRPGGLAEQIARRVILGFLGSSTGAAFREDHSARGIWRRAGA
jgi:acetyl esterase/lipase